MSQITNNASAIDDTHDDASTLLGKSVPLGELLDAHIAKAKESEITENYESPTTPSTPARTKMFDVLEGYTFPKELTRELMARDTCNGVQGMIDILYDKAMNHMMKCDTKLATYTTFVTNKDYNCLLILNLLLW